MSEKPFFGRRPLVYFKKELILHFVGSAAITTLTTYQVNEQTNKQTNKQMCNHASKNTNKMVTNKETIINKRN